MKFASEQPSFKPLTITLTSQAEVDFFYDLLASERISRVYGVEDQVVQLFEQLEDFASFDVDSEDDGVYVGDESSFQSVSHSVTFAEPNDSGLVEHHPCAGGCEACGGCNASDSQEHFEDVGDSSFESYGIKVETEGFARLIADVLGAMPFDIARVEYGISKSKLREISDATHRKAYKPVDSTNVTPLSIKLNA